MISSNLYDYINVLDKAADATYLRKEAIDHNIANQDTPGYKRIDVDFQSVLERELGYSKYVSLDSRMRGVQSHLDHLDVNTYVDSANYSYRIDENNVDPEQEYVQMAETQITYNALIDSMNQEFARIKSVIK
ncbi:MAG: flagellar basal body rod protein FlgB [Lachnospiraceae bacterium]|nr:flagellar basal body rod protein FlgB [Lachnospiraceae bacterium]MCI9150251.1 flagellar basal body rod protein FlgB [Lachnospiraceae bacterium]